MNNLEIHDLSSNHHYRTELPNILFEIGLKANELALYCAIKKSAGDNGYCTKSTKTLCKEAGVGERNFAKLKESLSKKVKILNKSLITVKKRKSEFGDPDTDFITIIDIWPENYRYYLDKNGGGAKLQVPGAELRGGVGAKLRGGGAKLQVKEEPIKKNPIKKTTTTNKSKSSSQSSCEISKEAKEAAKKAFDWINSRAAKEVDEKWNIDLNTLEKFFHLYDLDYISDQLNYLFERMNKYKANKNKPGNKTHPVDDPKVYFKKSCSENYANSLHKKEK